MKRRSREQAVYNRQSFSFAPGLGCDGTPAVGYAGVNGNDSSREASLEVDFQPRFQAGPTFALGQRGQSLANFSQGENAQIEDCLVSGIHPLEDTRFRIGPDKFGNAVGIEQIAAHTWRSMSLPGSLSRSRSSSMPTSGD